MLCVLWVKIHSKTSEPKPNKNCILVWAAWPCTQEMSSGKFVCRQGERSPVREPELNIGKIKSFPGGLDSCLLNARKVCKMETFPTGIPDVSCWRLCIRDKFPSLPGALGHCTKESHQKCSGPTNGRLHCNLPIRDGMAKLIVRIPTQHQSSIFFSHLEETTTRLLWTWESAFNTWERHSKDVCGVLKPGSLVHFLGCCSSTLGTNVMLSWA